MKELVTKIATITIPACNDWIYQVKDFGVEVLYDDEYAAKEYGEQDLSKVVKYSRLYNIYQQVITSLVREVSGCIEPKLYLGYFSKSGDQLIANWSVSDMAKPKEDHYNLHGQNISQWSYAGCVLIQNGIVSIHT